MFTRLVAPAVLFVCLCGVSSPAVSQGLWLDVPFVKQEKNGCGAASVAMVMQYWLKQQGDSASESADASQIQRLLYIPGSDGVYASALERYFQKHGFRTFSFRGEWDDFRHHLEKGRPLIVALRPSGDSGSLHYVVVAGLDSEREILLLNDPARRKLLKQNRAGFVKQWSATGNWTLLALPQPTGGG